MQTTRDQRLSGLLMWLAFGAGLGAVAYSAALAPIRADLVFLLLTLSALTLGPRLVVRAGRGLRVPLSDAFVVFALLQLGAGHAVALAALAALCDSGRTVRRVRGALFDAGVAAVSTFLCALALQNIFGDAAAGLARTPPATFVPALCLVALFLTAARVLGH
ncbi:MAG TPA: hypothetical protein VFX96_03605, partial [Pyrinomonadaceae bacterium]|nr:hypothetical protein [Pyrinomonadaceae bacterium]